MEEFIHTRMRKEALLMKSKEALLAPAKKTYGHFSKISTRYRPWWTSQTTRASLFSSPTEDLTGPITTFQASTNTMLASNKPKNELRTTKCAHRWRNFNQLTMQMQQRTQQQMRWSWLTTLQTLRWTLTLLHSNQAPSSSRTKTWCLLRCIVHLTLLHSRQRITSPMLATLTRIKSSQILKESKLINLASHRRSSLPAHLTPTTAQVSWWVETPVFTVWADLRTSS